MMLSNEIEGLEENEKTISFRKRDGEIIVPVSVEVVLEIPVIDGSCELTTGLLG